MPDWLESAPDRTQYRWPTESAAPGFFSRQCRTTRSRPGVILGTATSCSSAGSSLRIAFMVSTLESRLNARLPREHLVEDCAKSKNVGAMISRLRAHLLGRHVAHRAHHLPRCGVGMRHDPRSADRDCGAESLAWVNFARPKSRIFTRPSLSTKMLSGFKSR